MARTVPKNDHRTIKRSKRLGFLLMYTTAGRFDRNIDLQSRRERFNRYKALYLPRLREEDCYVCGKNAPKEWHHIIPIARGGEDRKSNLVPLCRTCHRLVHRDQRSAKLNLHPDPDLQPQLAKFSSAQTVVVASPKQVVQDHRDRSEKQALFSNLKTTAQAVYKKSLPKLQQMSGQTGRSTRVLRDLSPAELRSSVSPEWAVFDRVCHKHLSITGQEFLDRLDRDEYRGQLDTYPVSAVAGILTLVRP